MVESRSDCGISQMPRGQGTAALNAGLDTATLLCMLLALQMQAALWHASQGCREPPAHSAVE